MEKAAHGNQLLALPWVAGGRGASDEARRMLLLPSLAIAAVVLGAALLLSVVFAIVSVRDEPCRSYACGQFARRLQESMNRSFNPCYSFTRFVCEGWKERHAHSVRTEIFISALDRLSRLVRSAEPVGGAPEASRARQRVADLYRSCDAMVRDGRDETALVKKALAQAGVVWPARSKSPDVVRTLVYLSEVLHWPALVTVSVEEAAAWTTVVVREAHTFPRMLARQAKLGDPRDARRFFELLRTHFASAVGTSVTFEDMRAVEDRMLPPLRLAFRGGARGALPEPLADGRLVNQSEWAAAAARHWNVSSRVRLRAASPDFVATLLRMRQRHGEPDTHLYVSWCAVRYAALFANWELILDHYGGDRDLAALNYGRACFAMTYNFVGDHIFALYDSEVVRPITNTNVHGLVRAVRDAFVRRVSSREPFSRNTSFASGWHSVDSALRLVDLPPSAPTELPDVSDSLVVNWLSFWSLRRRPGYVAPSRSLSARPFQDCMFYTLNESDFVLSPFTLVLPFYDDGITAAVKYGGLGTQVGVASAELAFRFYRHLPEAAAALNESRLCFQYLSTSAAVPAPPDQQMAELAAVEAALDAFGRSGRAEDERWLVTPQLSAVQLLFITWCFVKCPGTGDPCSDVLRHVPRFSRAFGCSPDTVLNPRHKCSVF